MTKDMTQGSPLKLILAFAVPLMLGSLFQQFYNLADTIIVGWGGTYGHIYTAFEELNAAGKKVDFAQFRYINPLPKNTAEVLGKYKTVIVAELNNGQFANYLQGLNPSLNIKRINKVEGQPFLVHEIVEGVNKIMEGK